MKSLEVGHEKVRGKGPTTAWPPVHDIKQQGKPMTRITLTFTAIALMASIGKAEQLYDQTKIKTREQAAQAGSHVLQDWFADNGSNWDAAMRRCVHRVPASDIKMQYKCHACTREIE